MGYFGLSSRFAVLSLSLLALSGCQYQNKHRDPDWPGPVQDVVCPSPDPRCNAFSDSESPDPITPPDLRLCRIVETRLGYICGNKEPGLRCPGPGCPNGNPGEYNNDEARKCHLRDRVSKVKCTPTHPLGPVEGGAAQADPPLAAAPPPAPAAQ